MFLSQWLIHPYETNLVCSYSLLPAVTAPALHYTEWCWCNGVLITFVNFVIVCGRNVRRVVTTACLLITYSILSSSVRSRVATQDERKFNVTVQLSMFAADHSCASAVSVPTDQNESIIRISFSRVTRCNCIIDEAFLCNKPNVGPKLCKVMHNSGFHLWRNSL